MDVPTEIALFAGAGGGCLASVLMRHRIVCYVERDDYAAGVLRARIEDGMLDDAPIWDDVCTFDGKPWRGLVDIVSGGFPCQDVSPANATARGVGGGAKSGLWREFARIIAEVAPRRVFIENSQHLRTRGLDIVLRDLAGLGYDARWGVLSAGQVGAPHQRARMWILGHADHKAQQPATDTRRCTDRPGRADRMACDSGSNGQSACAGDAAEVARLPSVARLATDANSETLRLQPRRWSREGWQKASEPRDTAGRRDVDVSRVDDGVAHKLDRVRAIGNGQVPLVAQAAWRLLT